MNASLGWQMIIRQNLFTSTGRILVFKHSCGQVRNSSPQAIRRCLDTFAEEQQMESEQKLPDRRLCKTYHSYDDLWLCLVTSAADCPYKQKYWSERFCTYQDAGRYRVQRPVKSQ